MTLLGCGLGANVDALAHLSGPLLEETMRRIEGAERPALRPGVMIHRWDELIDALAWHQHHGSGAEYVIHAGSLMERLAQACSWEWSIGGTGLQAGMAAAVDGHRVIVNIPHWSTHDLSQLQCSRLELALGDTAPAPVHYVLEYAGREHLDQTIEIDAPRARVNRIIFRRAEEYRGRLVTDAFRERLFDCRNTVDGVLISGFNAAESLYELDCMLDEVSLFLQDFAPSHALVHLELGAIWSQEAQLRLITCLAPRVTSIGMSEEELIHIAGTLMPESSTEKGDYAHLLPRLQQRLGVHTLVLHTSGFAACLTEEDRDRWTRGLEYGLSLASARALTGRFCTAGEAAELLGNLPLNEEAMTMMRKGEACDGLVVVPGRVLGHVERTVGLGDTFAAGMLIGAAQHD